MDAKHTPGRMVVNVAQHRGGYTLDTEAGAEYGFIVGRKVAYRIAACWNAAEEAGLSTEALEAGVVKEAMHNVDLQCEIRYAETARAEAAEATARELRAAARYVVQNIFRCERCDGSGLDPSDRKNKSACPDCGGYGEVVCGDIMEAALACRDALAKAKGATNATD